MCRILYIFFYLFLSSLSSVTYCVCSPPSVISTPYSNVCVSGIGVPNNYISPFRYEEDGNYYIAVFVPKQYYKNIPGYIESGSGYYVIKSVQFAEYDTYNQIMNSTELRDSLFHNWSKSNIEILANNAPNKAGYNEKEVRRNYVQLYNQDTVDIVINNSSISKRIVQLGLGRVNHKYLITHPLFLKELLDVQQKAKHNKIGLWKVEKSHQTQ